MLQYKGYVGHAEYDAEVHAFHGEVLDTRDVITFQSDTVNGLERAFRESIDDYLEFCSQCGETRISVDEAMKTARHGPDLGRQLRIAERQQTKRLGGHE